jgi:hypothetical protein
MKSQLSRISLAVAVAMVVLHPTMSATTACPAAASAGLTVLTVPWEPLTPLSPHTTYPINATTEATVTLGATVPVGITTGDTVTVEWCFGDGDSAPVIFSNIYDISTTHQYPASASVGTAWIASVTVTDSTQKTSATANYYITQGCGPLSVAPCTAETALTSKVNVAIDTGLWYLHQTMWRNSTTVNSKTINWGGWDTQTYACPTVNGNAYACTYYGVINAENVQAFEVGGHVGTGPATDPYTDDVARGLARMFNFLLSQANITNTYQYNPATVNYGCSDGSQVQTNGTCIAPATQVFYNAGATSCTSPPCTFTFDGNNDGQMIYSNDGSGEYVYTTGPFMDSLVASATPTATAPTGPTGVLGLTYQNIVQNMVDWYAACQYEYDEDPGNEPTYDGYTRGDGYSASGGGWLYDCQQGDDNSTSQWAAIGFIAGNRGFNLAVPQVVKDMNNVWVTNSQDVTDPHPTGTDPFASSDNYGAFGYRGALAYSDAWGPFAVTPSGMVQMALDGIGRTNNTVFGNSSNAPDQRWNNTETFYADNFCNNPASDAYYSPRAYTYGMFSFTKSMLLHDPGGVLTPIQYLRTLTPSVFTGDSNDPANEIDWYAALSPANGGTDACDGVAQTLVGYQNADGHWYGNDSQFTTEQYPFETAWSLIMLRKTVFVSCVKNLNGRGTPSGVGSAQITLGWTAQSNANGYAVLRGTSNGGPYTQVGTTTTTVYNDRTGLTNGNTYYYVVQPLQGTTEICQSNQATITIPK